MRVTRLASAAVALGLFAGLADVARAEAAATDQDMSIGSPKAPVTVIEYVSPTGPHSARFRANVFPAFKAKYIDTGQVRFVLREVMIHPKMDGPAFLLARCAPEGGYFDVLDGVMRGQDEYFRPEIFQAPDFETRIGAAYKAVLLRIGQSVGLSEQQAISCMTDPTQIEKMAGREKAEAAEYEVYGAPTFVVGGRKVEPPAGHEADLAWLDSVLQPELAQEKS